MRIERFSGGYTRRGLYFPSSGIRQIGIDIPEGMEVQHVSFELEGAGVPDTKVEKIGIIASDKKEQKLLRTLIQGSGIDIPRVIGGLGGISVGERTGYMVEPLPPDELEDISVTVLRKRFDVLVVATDLDGPDLGKVIASELPLVLMRPGGAMALGMASSVKLEADMATVRVLGEDSLTELMGEGYLDISSGRRSRTPFIPKKSSKIPVVALDTLDCTVHVDTGEPSQALVLTSNSHKVVYMGFSDIRSYQDSEILKGLLGRSLSWCGAGGVPSGVSVRIQNEDVRFEEGELEATLGVTWDRCISPPASRGTGSWVLSLELSSRTPGKMTLTNLEVIAKRVVELKSFMEGEEVVQDLETYPISSLSPTIDLPRNARVRKASVSVSLDEISSEIHHGWELEPDGATLAMSPEYVIRQEMDVEALSRVRFLVKGGPVSGRIGLAFEGRVSWYAFSAEREVDMHWIDMETGKVKFGASDGGDPPSLIIETLEGECSLLCGHGRKGERAGPFAEVSREESEFISTGTWLMVQAIGPARNTGYTGLLEVGGSNHRIDVGKGATGTRRLNGLGAPISRILQASTGERVRVPVGVRVPFLGRLTYKDLYVRYELSENEGENAELSVEELLKQLRGRVANISLDLEILERQIRDQG